MEERRSERSRKCAELCILDRSEKFGQDRDRSDCLSTRVRVDSAMIGCDRVYTRCRTDLSKEYFVFFHC